MEFRILGRFEVTDGGTVVELHRAKLRTLLAMLVVHPNQVVSADRLAEALWDDSPPATAANTLQSYVSHLRQALTVASGAPGEGALIETRAPGYRLTVDPERIDAHRFEALVAEGRHALAAPDLQRAAVVFAEALSLWRGPALVDFADERFASGQATRLDELRLAALEEQAEVELALGHHAERVGHLQALIEDHPLRERLWGQLMIALYRCGRQAEALRAFQSVKRRLAEELGIDPSPALRRLEADILIQARSLERDSALLAPGGRIRPAARGVPFPRLLLAGPAVDYVGRSELMACLQAAREQAAAGACRVVLLSGEPGVGKTRTAAEVARAAFDDGAIVLYGRCDEEAAVPYQPFAEVLDWYTAHVAEPLLGRHPGELPRLQPLLPARVSGLTAPVSSDPRSEEYLLFEATRSWLVELARQQPLVLVLDDLHWAAKPVLSLLRHIVRAAASERDPVPLLVLGTYRDTEVDRTHPLGGVMADLRRVQAVERWTVVGLSLAEVEEFVARSVGQDLDHDSRRLAESLHQDTEGNPFFIDEVLRHLVETGTVRHADDRWVMADHSPVTVPETVRDVIGRRLGRLSADANEALTVAAVLGQNFEVEVLAALTDLPEGRLLDALDEGSSARLVEETDADRYRFCHALVRHTLAEGLSATRRRRLHRRVAEALEKLRAGDVVALAFHFTEAGPEGADTSRAVHYTLAAAEQALEARALADAETRFSNALQLLAGPAQRHAPERLRALCGLGEAQRDQGNSGFRITLLEAARLAEAAGEAALLVRAALSNSRGVPSVIGGFDEERVAVTEAALDVVGSTSSAERARLLAQLAAEISFTHDDRRRLALSDEAEEMARALGDSSLLAWVLNRTGYAAFSHQRVKRLVARGEEATLLSDATGDPSQRVLSRYFWSAALLTVGDLAEFTRVTEQMLAVANDAAPTLQWLALVTQARLSMLDGDVIGVRRINDDAFRLAQDLGEPDGAAWWAATLCPLEWHRGALGQMLEVLSVGVDQYPDEQAWRIGYILALALVGRTADARDVLNANPLRLDELPDHVFPFFNAQMVAFIAFHLDDRHLAAQTAELLRPHGQCWAHQYAATIGPVSFAEAVCAAATGDLDAAVTLFEETEQRLVDLDCGGVLPHLRAYYAEILLRRGSHHDRGAATDLLQKVRRGAAQLDAPILAARADNLAARLAANAEPGNDPSGIHGIA